MKFNFHFSSFFIWFAFIQCGHILAQTSNLPIETVIQRGHEAPILTANFDPSGELIATGGEDQNVILWESNTGRQLRTFTGHVKSITDVDFHPKLPQLLTSSYDGNIILWNIVTGKRIRTYTFNHWLNTVRFSPDGSQFITGGKKDFAKLVNVESGKIEQTYKVNPGQYGVNLRFSPDGNFVASGNDDGRVIIYEKSNGMARDTLRNISSSMCGGCWAFLEWAETEELIYASRNGPVTIFNPISGKIIEEYGEKEGRPNTAGATQKYIFSAEENKISIWKRSGEKLNTIENGKENINHVVLHPIGNRLLSVGSDQVARIWDIKSGRHLSTLSGYLNRKNERGLSFSKTSYWHSSINKYLSIRNRSLVSPDGKLMIKGHMDSLALIVDIKSGRVIHTLVGHEKIVISYLFMPNSQQVVTSSGDRTIKIWDLKSGKALKTLKGHRDLVFELALSSNNQYLVSGSWDGTAILWNLETGQQIKQYKFENNSPFSISFAHRDQYLAVAGLSKDLKLVEIDTGQPAKNFIGHSDIITSTTIHQNLLLTGSLDGKAKLWNIETGLQEMKWDGHIGGTYDVLLLKEAAQILTAGADRTAKLWDRSTGKLLKTFVGHEGPVTSVQVINMGKTLVTSSLDGTTRFWDIHSGTALATHILFGKNEWLSKDKNGYFDATEQAKQNVFFVKGLYSYDLDQFFEKFYKPNILNKSLSQASESRNSSVAKSLENSPPPSVSIISPAIGEKVKSDQIEMLLKITNMGGGIDEVRVMHNGKRLSSGDRSLMVERENGESIYQRIAVQLIPGKNVFSVSAFSKERIESIGIKREIYLEADEQDITCHVLTIGINAYKNASLNLNYAHEDAAGFLQLIVEKGKKLYKNIELYPVYNKDASKANIMSMLDEVAVKAKPQDVFFFYYAGHGSTVNGNFYFIPTDNVRLYDAKRLNASAIMASDIQAKFAQIKALKQMVVIDACNAGSSTKVLASRGAEEEKALAQLSRSSGVHVLAAAGSEQFAAEFEQLGHGLFTYVLLEAMSGKADGAPKDGKVTIYELKSYLDDQVPEYSIKYRGQPQFPVTYSIGQDFPITIDN